MKRYETLILKIIAIILLPLSFYASTYSAILLTYSFTEYIDTGYDIFIPDDPRLDSYKETKHYIGTYKEICGDLGDALRPDILDFWPDIDR